MLNGSGRNDGLARTGTGLRFRNTGAPGGARLPAEAASGEDYVNKVFKPAPFNGLLTNKLLTALPGEDFARLLPHFEPASLTCGKDLYEIGESVRYVYFPETAVLSHLYILADGSTTEAAMVGKEGLTGLYAIFDSPAPAYSTTILITGTAIRARTEVLKEELANGGAVQRMLLGYAGECIEYLSQRVICNGRHTVGERLCTWLLMIHDRTGETLLPLTHEQIASHLGARRAGITEAMISLRERQFIGNSRGQIQIVDRLALEGAACECYPALTRRSHTRAQL